MTTAATTRPKYTASEVILLAGATFKDREFTKWQVAVVAWKIDPETFGMRGFETEYPDTNRTMLELVSTRQAGPIYLGYFKPVGPSTYRMTPGGLAAAAALSAANGPDNSGSLLYGTMRGLLDHYAFVRWCSDPSEPREIAAGHAFVGSQGLGQLRSLVGQAREWCLSRGVEMLAYYRLPYHRGSVPHPKDPPPITFADLANLDDFLTALEYRFPELKADASKRKACAS